MQSEIYYYYLYQFESFAFNVSIALAGTVSPRSIGSSADAAFPVPSAPSADRSGSPGVPKRGLTSQDVHGLCPLSPAYASRSPVDKRRSRSLKDISW